MSQKKQTTRHPKIALVHDYLAEFGGAERVLETLHQLYPTAPVYVAFVNKPGLGAHWQRFTDWDIRTTWLQKIPGIIKLFSPLRFLAKSAFESLDLSEYDVVISSSNAYFGKAVQVPNGIHICYCHTPPRALYGYNTRTNWRSNIVMRWLGTLLNHFVRIQDYYASQAVDVFIANSKETQRRITKFYRRESVVINPPVKVPKIAKSKMTLLQDREYFLYVNRLNFAKHPELAVEVCTKLQLPLKVAGSGSMLEKLEAMAGATVSFLGSVSDDELQALYAGAKALLYPAEDEDFGMVPIEAMGYGVPVLAHNSGGPKETIIDGKTGILFDSLSVDGLEQALNKYEKTSFDPAKINAHAQQYNEASFQQAIQKLVRQSLS